MKKDITIHPTAMIAEAMRALGKTTEKTLLVVDEKKRLLGSLTDGDIRRYILQDNNLERNISGGYCRNPICLQKDSYTKSDLRDLFKENRITVIPVVNKLGKLVDYVTNEEILNGTAAAAKRSGRLNAPVVIMAGGKGTRLEPFTKILPKPLVPVCGRAVIDIIMEKFQNFGLDHFYISINHKAKIIKAYFEERSPECKISYLDETEPLGTAGSLRMLIGQVSGPVFVSNCDNIIDTDYAELYAFHTQNHYDITLVASLKEFNIPYGVCEVEKSGSLNMIREKPEYSFLVNTGLYILDERVIHAIPENTVFHMTELINKVKKQGGNIGVYPIGDDSWIDIGEWSEYRNAINTLEGRVVSL